MTRHFKLSWLVALTTFFLTSCSSNSDSGDEQQAFEDKAEAFPVKVESGDNWSLVKKNGKMLYSDEFA